jgi:hypothetical protein
LPFQDENSPISTSDVIKDGELVKEERWDTSLDEEQVKYALCGV